MHKPVYSSAGTFSKLKNVLRHSNPKFTASDRWGRGDAAIALGIFPSNRSLWALSDLCLLAEWGVGDRGCAQDGPWVPWFVLSATLYKGYWQVEWLTGEEWRAVKSVEIMLQEEECMKHPGTFLMEREYKGTFSSCIWWLGLYGPSGRMRTRLAWYNEGISSKVELLRSLLEVPNAWIPLPSFSCLATFSSPF